jgi:HlyD family type I secretion membrane fusion protein
MDDKQKTASGVTYAPEQEMRRVMRFGLVIIALMFFGLGSWAALAPLSGAVIAAGTVMVDGSRKTVQHLEGGIVKEILVHDGDHVKAGQPLIVLGDATVSASVDLLQTELDSEQVKESRLTAEKSLTEFQIPERLINRTKEPEIQSIIHGEKQLFNARREALNSQTALLRRQIEELQKEISGVGDQVQSEQKAIAFMQEDLHANEALVEKQFVQKTHLLQLKKDLADHEALRSEHVADLSRARQKITELELRIASLRSNYMQQASDDLEGTIKKIRDLEERILPSKDALKRQVVVAPVEGTVVGLKVHTTGGVIGPKEPLLDIVPSENALIVEARISVNDIDEVRPGTAADIHFSAYKSRTTPIVTGKVFYVAADSAVDEQGKVAYYITRIKADAESLRQAADIQLYPGMPAEIFIRTGDRTALQYILEPITDTLRRTMRES